MAKPLAQRIEEARLKKAQHIARLAKLEGQAKQANRKLDTRRKIIIGAAVLSEIEREPRFAAQIRDVLGKAVTREQDRAAIAFLLDQPATPKPELKPAAAEATVPPPAPPAPPQVILTAPDRLPPAASAPGPSGPFTPSQWPPRVDTLRVSRPAEQS